MDSIALQFIREDECENSWRACKMRIMEKIDYSGVKISQAWQLKWHGAGGRTGSLDWSRRERLPLRLLHTAHLRTRGSQAYECVPV